MNMNFIEEKSKEVNGKTYKRKIFDLGGHYIVTFDLTSYNGGKTIKNIDVEPKNDSEFLPKIYFHDDFYGENREWFEVQTTAYGTLDSIEFGRFIAAQIIARDALVSLNIALTSTFMEE